VRARPRPRLFYTFRVADADADGSDDISYGGWHGDPVHVWLSSAGTFSVAHQLSVSGCYATASDWADYDGDLDIAVTGGCNGPLEMSSPARGSRGPRLAAPARAVPGGSVKSSNDNGFLASEIL
jgi:hypothetical protein